MAMGIKAVVWKSVYWIVAGAFVAWMTTWPLPGHSEVRFSGADCQMFDINLLIAIDAKQSGATRDEFVAMVKGVAEGSIMNLEEREFFVSRLTKAFDDPNTVESASKECYANASETETRRKAI